MSGLGTGTNGAKRFKRAVQRWRQPPGTHYQEPPSSPSEAETRSECDKLRAQVKINRRLLLALTIAVVLRGLWNGETETLTDLIQALVP